MQKIHHDSPQSKKQNRMGWCKYREATNLKGTNMWKVDIYLEISSTFQGKRQRKCGYVLATTVRGEEKTKESFANANGTYHQTTLQTIVEALSRMTAPSQIYRREKHGN